MIRLVIAEPRTIVRWGLREAFSKVRDMEVVGEAGTVEEAIAAIGRTKPDVLLLDPALPDHSGYDVMAEIRELDSSPLVVVLAARADPIHGAHAMAAGAHGYVSMSAEPEQLLEAIRAVSRGERVAPAEVEALLAAGDGHPAARLTRRELQVMEMIARGLTNREIAEHLDISVKTVDTHRGHVLKKLVLRNNSELTRFAVRHGYVSA